MIIQVMTVEDILFNVLQYNHILMNFCFLMKIKFQKILFMSSIFLGFPDF